VEEMTDDWQDARKAPPPLGQQVYIYTDSNNQCVAVRTEKYWSVLFSDMIFEPHEVTHWRPTHKPPEQEEGPIMYTYSGFTTDSPINFSAFGKIFIVHATNHEGAKKFVHWLNEKWQELDK